MDLHIPTARVADAAWGRRDPAGSTDLSRMRLTRIILAAVMLAGLSSCRSPDRSLPPEPSATAVSLQDQQLLDIIEAEQELERRAAEDKAEFTEIQRIFRQVDQMYASFLSRNPENLESRLLYGKLLLRYHDLEGARIQFLVAAKLAERSGEQIAVIHQQLSTIAAEEGDYSRAVVFADNAIKIDPMVAAYHYGLGQILAAFRQGLIDDEVFEPQVLDQKILQCFATAVELEPDTLPLLFRYGEAFYDVGDPDWQLALQHWQSLANRNDLAPLQMDAVRLHQARCYIELGQPDLARNLTKDIQSPQLRESANSLF